MTISDDTTLPEEVEGYAVQCPDGSLDPDLIYRDEPETWSRVHGRPVWLVRIVPMQLAADFYGDVHV